MSAIALAAIGPLPDGLTPLVAEALCSAFGLPVQALPPLAEPQDAYSPRRQQWLASAFLEHLLKAAPAEPLRVLGLTERDLFVPVLSFVYGQAQLEGRVAVVSLARLRPEFHGLPPDATLLGRRAATEAVHELGHTLGLVHCLDRRCPMSLSIDLADLDRKTAEPCPACAALVEGSSLMRRARAVAEGGRT